MVFDQPSNLGPAPERVQFSGNELGELMNALHKVDGIVRSVENISVETGIELLQSEGRKGAFTASGVTSEEGAKTHFTVTDAKSVPVLNIDLQVRNLADDKQDMIATISRPGESVPLETVHSSFSEGGVRNNDPVVQVDIDVQGADHKLLRHGTGSLTIDDRTVDVKFSDGSGRPSARSMKLSLDGQNVHLVEHGRETVTGTSVGLSTLKYEIR